MDFFHWFKKNTIFLLGYGANIFHYKHFHSSTHTEPVLILYQTRGTQLGVRGPCGQEWRKESYFLIVNSAIAESSFFKNQWQTDLHSGPFVLTHTLFYHLCSCCFPRPPLSSELCCPRSLRKQTSDMQQL